LRETIVIETPVFGRAAVASPHHLANETGARILGLGGNAIEAMVAMAATIAVVFPHMNAIGGDGFWLIADKARRVRFIDACGPAGSKATIRAYRDAGHDAVPTHGVLSALTVPGAVGGWRLVLMLGEALGGKLPLDVLMEEAIRHAKEGVPVSAAQARVDRGKIAPVKAAPGFAGVFLKDGEPLALGEIMRQPALAATLDQLAQEGLDDFYRGDVGREMAADLERIECPVTREDLRRFEARIAEPLSLALTDATLYNSPPPTQGLAALVTVGLFERLGVRQAESFEHLHGLIEAGKQAMAVRERVITDPAHLTEDPADCLAPSLLDRQAAAIAPRRAGPGFGRGEPGDTVWMGACDHDGLCVSYLQSIFGAFGSGVVLPRTGILLHNRGTSFSLDPRHKNPLEPGRKPFHTLSPAIALFGDGRVMAYGTMGGGAQPAIQAQILSRYRLGQGLAEAIDRPRFVPGQRGGDGEALLRLESRFDEGLVRALREAGHQLVVEDIAYGDAFGHAGALIRHSLDGRIQAAHDPRADGGALGF
jgi:gamma-glutamyltranspeptidase/glutathione hydrolase